MRPDGSLSRHATNYPHWELKTVPLDWSDDSTASFQIHKWEAYSGFSFHSAVLVFAVDRTNWSRLGKLFPWHAELTADPMWPAATAMCCNLWWSNCRRCVYKHYMLCRQSVYARRSRTNVTDANSLIPITCGQSNNLNSFYIWCSVVLYSCTFVHHSYICTHTIVYKCYISGYWYLLCCDLIGIKTQGTCWVMDATQTIL